MRTGTGIVGQGSFWPAVGDGGGQSSSIMDSLSSLRANVSQSFVAQAKTFDERVMTASLMLLMLAGQAPFEPLWLYNEGKLGS